MLIFIVSWRTLGKQFLQLLPRVPCKPLPRSLSGERTVPHENSCSENLLSLQWGPKALKPELSLHQGFFASGPSLSCTDWPEKQHGASKPLRRHPKLTICLIQLWAWGLTNPAFPVPPRCSCRWVIARLHSSSAQWSGIWWRRVEHWKEPRVNVSSTVHHSSPRPAVTFQPSWNRE